VVPTLAASPLGSTNETWTGPHIESAPPAKRSNRAGLIAAVLALAVVGLGITSFALLSGKSDEAATGTLPSSSAVAGQPSAPASVVEPVAKAPEPKVEATPVVEPAPAAVAPKAEPKAPAPAVAARPARRVAAPAAAAPAPKPKDTAGTTTTTSGRRIRQSL
jgi:hypothetical protein